MLNGELGVITGSRFLANLCSRVSSLEHDPDFLFFIGLDSETDHLPIGEIRQHWAPDALASKDEEIREAEAFYRDHAMAACKALLVRFQ